MRRALIIFAILLILVGAGAVAYFYFFVRTAGIAVAPIGSGSLPVAGQGTTGAGTAGSTGANTPTNGTAAVVVSPRLVEISSGPVVTGEDVVDAVGTDASSSPEIAVSYIERESGNVFSYLTSARTLMKTSNKTIPGIQSASWLPDGSAAFVRYLSGADFSTINTYALSANGTEGFFLPQNLADIAVSSTSILALASGVNGSSASLLHTDGTPAMLVFASPLSALHISFAGKSHYLATTKPSAAFPGYAFLVDTAGHFSRIAGPQDGLVALSSPSGKWVLVSYTRDTAMQMELVNTATGETTPLPLATIADKCVWAADDSAIYCGIPVSPPAGATYPDDWYQGAVHFSDRIWKIDVAGRYAQLVLDFSNETKGSLDVESPAIDEAGREIVFVNKNDGSLWSYSL